MEEEGLHDHEVKLGWNPSRKTWDHTEAKFTEYKNELQLDRAT